MQTSILVNCFLCLSCVFLGDKERESCGNLWPASQEAMRAATCGACTGAPRGRGCTGRSLVLPHPLVSPSLPPPAPIVPFNPKTLQFQGSGPPGERQGRQCRRVLCGRCREGPSRAHGTPQPRDEPRDPPLPPITLRCPPARPGRPGGAPGRAPAPAGRWKRRCRPRWSS